MVKYLGHELVSMSVLYLGDLLVEIFPACFVYVLKVSSNLLTHSISIKPNIGTKILLPTYKPIFVYECVLQGVRRIRSVRITLIPFKLLLMPRICLSCFWDAIRMIHSLLPRTSLPTCRNNSQVKELIVLIHYYLSMREKSMQGTQPSTVNCKNPKTWH